MTVKILQNQGRHSVLAFISLLPISVVCILDIEANGFYDSSNQLYDTALSTRGYTQHAFRPYIDSEINHKHYLIRIKEWILLTCLVSSGTIRLFYPF